MSFPCLYLYSPSFFHIPLCPILSLNRNSSGSTHHDSVSLYLQGLFAFPTTAHITLRYFSLRCSIAYNYVNSLYAAYTIFTSGLLEGKCLRHLLNICFLATQLAKTVFFFFVFFGGSAFLKTPSPLSWWIELALKCKQIITLHLKTLN